MKHVDLARKSKSSTHWTRLAAAGLIAVAALAGCGGGDDGAPGATGPKGDPGIAGAPGADRTLGTVNAKQLAYADLTDRALSGKVIAVDTSGEQPVVKFQVVMKGTNEGLAGLGTFSLHIDQLQPPKDGKASYWLNYIADGLPLSAIPANVARGSTTPVAPTNPAADAVSLYNADGTVKAQGYSVIDGGDGTYTVTFGAKIKQNTKVIYDPTLVHRVVVGVRTVSIPGVIGKTPGAYAGPINPSTGLAFSSFTNTNGVNLVYDFTPAASGAGTPLATPARDNVTVAACNTCHGKIEYGFPRGNNTSGHFGSRPDTKTCVMCHTPQNAYVDGAANGAGDFTSFIHKIHMGEELPPNKDPAVDAAVNALVNVAEIKYPQDQRQCTTCHKGTVTDSWANPSQKACGSCHNNVDFTITKSEAVPNGHTGGPRTDAQCALCHDKADISLNHVAVIEPDPNNAFTNSAVIPGTTAIAGNNQTNASYVAAAGVVPAGAAKISYVVTSVTRDATSGNPSIKFKFQKSVNGATPTDVVFNTYPAKAEMMDGFVGSPSVYFAWSEPQDGIAAPADYNVTVNTYIKNMWRGDGLDVKGAALSATSIGTWTVNSDGTYTITLTGVKVSSGAKMLTGGVGYSYGLSTTLPLTQVDLPAYPYTPNAPSVNSGVGGVGGLSVPPANVWKVATGFTGRRLIVETPKCNSCHAALGVKPTFHAGQRNDGQTCTFCHTVNRTNSGWPVNISYDVHAIHNGNSGQRVNKFSWEANTGAKFWEVGYPGQLKNCESCHATGMYDFTNSAYTSALPNLLMTTAASGTIKKVGDTVSSTDTRLIASVKVATKDTDIFDSLNLAISPFVTAGQAFGSAYAWNANTGVVTNEAADTTLVLTPISSACSGCHDSTIARNHMQTNGGTVFGTRLSAKTNATNGVGEACLTCHGPANNTFNETTPTIKTAHRWW